MQVNAQFTIRVCAPNDLESVRAICLAAAMQPVTAVQRAVFPLLYCDYYVMHESQNCFILQYGDRAVGYILSSYADDYIKIMKRDYLPQVRHIDKKEAAKFLFGYTAERILCRGYKAHLHIDILPEFQRQGQGSKLMDTLLAHLQTKGVQRVMLGCSAHNQKGVCFYQKYGFRTLYKDANSHIFGIETVRESR